MDIIINKEYINYIRDKREKENEIIHNKQMFPYIGTINTY
jgi:hypothetical protein